MRVGQEAYAIMGQRAQPKRAKPGVEVFVENLPGNVYRRVRRPDGSYFFEYLSSGLFRQFGIDHERLLSEETIRFDWIHPDDQARMISDLEVSAATLGLLDQRIRVVGQDGRVHWARGIGRPSRRPDGSSVWDGIVIDVTREVEAEAALRLAKEEADRAHRFAARLVTEATSRLDMPVRDLGLLLDGIGESRPSTATIRGLRTCAARLSAALREFAPPRGIEEGAFGARDERRVALTRRQQEVHRLLAAGLSNKAIAHALKITPGTAKLHVAAVLRAVGARSRKHVRSAAQP
jgi:DNA-binding CsgD family transcriptional regulator